MPRLVRRAPLAVRLAAALNPLDLFFRLCEEIDSQDWDAFTEQWRRPVALGLNLVFLIARANSSSGKRLSDDTFEDVVVSRSGFGSWVSWLASTVTFILTVFSLLNAAYTFTSRRRYRMFEAPIDQTPSTPSARRVPADSAPASSPFHKLLNAVQTPLSKKTAFFSHQKKEKKVPEVWELSIWNPSVLSLSLFCAFSPGHVLVYDLLLPVSSYDSRPSVTVVKAIFFGFLLTFQLSYLHSYYAQQSRDLTILNKAVANEYEVKFVRPSTTRIVRDVGVQTNARSAGMSPERDGRGRRRRVSEVDVYPAASLRTQGFTVRPNPTYAPLLDLDESSSSGSSYSESWQAGGSSGYPYSRPSSRLSAGVGTNSMSMSGMAASPTPPVYKPLIPSSNGLGVPSSARKSGMSKSTGPSPYRTSIGGGGMSASAHLPSVKRETLGDGGSLGVYSHADSPLRKARVSMAGVPKSSRR